MTFLLNGALAIVAALWFRRQLPEIRRTLRPIYRRLGIITDGR